MTPEAEIRKFLDERAKIRGLDHAEIASLHTGDEREAALRTADISALLDEVVNLRTRLELDESGVDGIQRRDATIAGLEREVARLRAELKVAQYNELAANEAAAGLESQILELREKLGASQAQFIISAATMRERLAAERERCIEEIRGVGGAFAVEAEAAIRALGDEA